jgi:hypothetical protein
VLPIRVSGDAEQQDACRGLRRSLAHGADRARRGLTGKSRAPRAPGPLVQSTRGPIQRDVTGCVSGLSLPRICCDNQTRLGPKELSR